MRQDISAQDVHRAADEFSRLIQGIDGGKLIKKEYWGLRGLAHIIKKNRRGHYIMLGLEVTDVAINELERNFKINEDILRFISLKVDAISQEPSHMMSVPADLEQGSNAF